MSVSHHKIAPVTICAPAFPEFAEYVDLAPLGLKNGDEAEYGFGFSQGITDSEYVKPDFIVKLKWRDEDKLAQYESDSCFYSNTGLVDRLMSGFQPMKDVNDRAMCQVEFEKMNLKSDCIESPKLCSNVKNPYYKLKTAESTNSISDQYKVGLVDFREIGNLNRPSESEIQSGINPSTNGDISPGTDSEIPEQSSKGFDEIPASDPSSLTSSSLSTKGKRNARGLWRRFVA